MLIPICITLTHKSPELLSVIRELGGKAVNMIEVEEKFLEDEKKKAKKAGRQAEADAVSVSTAT
jgi:hypothetical protein